MTFTVFANIVRHPPAIIRFETLEGANDFTEGLLWDRPEGKVEVWQGRVKVWAYERHGEEEEVLDNDHWKG